MTMPSPGYSHCCRGHWKVWAWHPLYMRFTYHQLSEDANNFHSNCVWLSALVFLNWTLFAVMLIYIEMGQFCTKCMHNTSFKYVQIALRPYLLGSAVRGAFRPLQVLWELHGSFLSRLCRFSGRRSRAVPLWICPWEFTAMLAALWGCT